MANGLYTLTRQKFLNGDIDWTDDDIKVALVDTDDYTANLATDEFLDDIPGGAIVATSGNLSGKTSTGGVADADDVTLSSVTGDESEAVVVYQDTGNAATSPLIAYIDTATGLAVTPTGANIEITWNASGIFAI